MSLRNMVVDLVLAFAVVVGVILWKKPIVLVFWIGGLVIFVLLLWLGPVVAGKLEKRKYKGNV